MPYSQQVWNNGPESGTPLNALRLNHMEAGIGAAALAADNANAGVASAGAALTDFENTVGRPGGPASNEAPIVRLRQNTTIDLPRNTWKAAIWDTAQFDDYGQFSSTSNTRFTCKVKGVYYLQSVIYINAWQNNQCSTELRKNGVSLDASWRCVFSVGPPTTVQTNEMAALNVGDYIEVWGQHDATTDATGYRKLYGAVLNAMMVRPL